MIDHAINLFAAAWLAFVTFHIYQASKGNHP